MSGAGTAAGAGSPDGARPVPSGRVAQGSVAAPASKSHAILLLVAAAAGFSGPIS